MTVLQEDHWSASAYQNSAAFVPKLATKVLGWLDVGADDVILDVGCGDGILNLQIAEVLKKGKGKIHGIDSSEAMIAAAKRDAKAAGVEEKCTFEVFDATSGPVGTEQYDKVFSNAAMHWILRPVEHRESFFRSIHSCLKRNGTFVFEMGGMGNVGEMRTALLSVISRRVGIQKTREIDPWFFPDEIWMTRMLEVTVGGFKVERIEREFRPTRATEGEGEGVGIRGWVVFMGKQFFDVIEDKEERGRCVDEVVELLGSVCASPGGGDWIGYVRLRAIVRKV